MDIPMDLSAPAQGLYAVTPSDSVDLPNGWCRGLYVGVTGDLSVDDLRGNTAVIIKAAAVGYHPISIKRVRATSTTATNIVALY